MKQPIAYGIDFGTTNSSISIAYDDGDIRLVELDAMSELPHSMPSIVYLHRGGNRQAGRSAIEEFLMTGSQSTRCNNCSIPNKILKCKQYRPGGECQDSRLMSGLKSQLSKNVITHSWAEDFDLKDLVAVILSDLKERADRFIGREVDKVIIGMPVIFAGTKGDDYNDQQRARMTLKGAIKRAGFSEIEIYPEPAAVLLGQYQGLDDGFSLAVDFGGGTYDVAVLAIKERKAEKIVLQGTAVGGEVFDCLIFKKGIADIIGLNKTSNGKSLPRWISNGMCTLSGVAGLLRNKNLLPALHNFADGGADISIISAILRRGQAFNFYKAIEKAKIDLSEKGATSVEFHGSGIDISQEIHRKDFEEWISPSLDKVDATTKAALNKAGIKPGQVHTVLRTGGSSQIPLFIQRLEKMFPKAEIRERPAFTSVAYGLGKRALEVWG